MQQNPIEFDRVQRSVEAAASLSSSNSDMVIKKKLTKLESRNYKKFSKTFKTSIVNVKVLKQLNNNVKPEQGKNWWFKGNTLMD